MDDKASNWCKLEIAEVVDKVLHQNQVPLCQSLNVGNQSTFTKHKNLKGHNSDAIQDQDNLLGTKLRKKHNHLEDME